MEGALFDDILYRLKYMDRYGEFKDFLEYVKNNRKAFTPEQLSELELESREIYHSFDPRDCNAIRSLTLIYGPRDEQNLYGNKAISMCARAHQARIPLPDYIFSITHAKDFVIHFYAEAREAAVGESGIKPELLRMRSEISELKKIMRGRTQEPRYEEEPSTYTMDVILTPREFHILNRTPGAYEHTLLRKTGKDYIVRITDKSREDIENELERIRKEAAKEIQISREKRKSTEPQYSDTDLENISRILCDKYKRVFPDYSCPTALTALAKRIAQYLFANDLSWDSPGVDIKSIDIFLKSTPNRVYTRELADEVFNVVIATLGNREAGEPDACDPDVVYPVFAELEALNILYREQQLNDKGKQYREDVIKELKRCGFKYINYSQWIDDADRYFGEYGTSLNTQSEALYERFRRKYGE